MEQASKPTQPEKVLVSVESPYTASNWFRFQQHLQYGVLCNKHAASLGDATFAPHLCNTQFVLYGVQAYIGDVVGKFLLATKMFSKASKYAIGREKTLEVTNLARIQSCRKICVYTDFGVSDHMLSAIKAAEQHNIPIERRRLPDELMRNVVGKSIESTVMWSVSTTPYVFTTGFAVKKLFQLAKFVAK